MDVVDCRNWLICDLTLSVVIHSEQRGAIRCRVRCQSWKLDAPRSFASSGRLVICAQVPFARLCDAVGRRVAIAQNRMMPDVRRLAGSKPFCGSYPLATLHQWLNESMAVPCDHGAHPTPRTPLAPQQLAGSRDSDRELEPGERAYWPTQSAPPFSGTDTKPVPVFCRACS